MELKEKEEESGKWEGKYKEVAKKYEAEFSELRLELEKYNA